MFPIGVYITTYKKKAGKAAALLLMTLITATAVMGQNTGKPKESSLNDPMVLMMVIVMLILLLIIGLLAHVVIGAATWYREKEKAQEQKKLPGKTTLTTVCIIGLMLFAAPLFAQDTKAVTGAAQTVRHFGNLSPVAFYFMTGVLVIELLVIFALLYQLHVFLAKEKLLTADASGVVYKLKPRKSLWDKLNSFRPVEQEKQIDLGHNYDGIRELDNRLPPWWLYGFYLTIIFAVVYLWRYHVSETAPLSGQEYAIAMKQAEVQKAAYLKKSANNVDENTVKLITDAQAIAGGKTAYDQNCSACHGKAGEGTVGPNLTDNYWLHGGSVNDIFKSIKYGWPEKGMRSWKDDLSPSQIAQLTGYIKTLHGTNPPNAKENQGQLYQENATEQPGDEADSANVTNKVALRENSK